MHPKSHCTEHGGMADLGSGGGWSTPSVEYVAFNVSLLDLHSSLYITFLSNSILYSTSACVRRYLARPLLNTDGDP